MQRGNRGYLRHQGVELHLVETLDDALELKRWMSERPAGIRCFDTETSGLRPDFDRVRLAQFGDMKHGWAVPFERWGGVVMELLRNYEEPLGLHNSKFDARQIMHEEPSYEWPWHRTHDTMTLAHLANPLRPKGLKPLMGQLIDPEAVQGERALHQGMAQNGWDWATVPVDYPPYWIYGALDPVGTSYILDELGWAIEEYKDAYDLELAVTRVVAKMEKTGMRINPTETELTNAKLLNYVQDLRLWMAEEWKLSNPTDLGLIKFFHEQGVKMLDKKTKAGRQAMDKEVLDSINHPVAEAVREMRGKTRLANTYCKNLLELRDSDDRLHANFWTMGTRTARMSITDPALQTLPKKDRTIRNLFIPSEGHSLITFDMDQVEARLMAYFCGSQPMIDAFKEGELDFFCMVASKVFDEEITSKKDPRRQMSKGTTYGKIYGGGAETLAARAGVGTPVMESFLAGFDSQFPEVTKLQKQLQKLMADRQRVDGESWIKTPLGRRLVADEDKEYTATNYLIQSHAAEIMKQKLVLLDTILPEECKLLLSVHDEIVMEAPDEMIADLMPFIQENLDDYTTYPLPLTWGGAYSKESWGALVD